MNSNENTETGIETKVKNKTIETKPKNKNNYFNSIANNMCDRTLEEYLQNNIEDLKSETPIGASYFENELILYCHRNDYDHAIRNLDLTPKMENTLNKYTAKEFEINTPQGEFILSKVNGTHSEYKIFHLRNK